MLASAICRGFIPIADHAYGYMRQMQGAGFSAFVPRNEFIESFAANAEELEIHRRCVIETAKEQLGRPSPGILRNADELKQIYFSPFLQDLRVKRNKENGVSEHEVSPHYSGGEAAWRREIDPCQRRIVRDGVENREAHQTRFNAMLQAEREALRREAPQHVTGMASQYAFDQMGRYNFFSAAMDRDAGVLGFSFDKRKSRQNSPVFSKRINDDWDLCWDLVQPYGAFSRHPFEGYLNLNLALCSHAVRGSLDNVERGEVASIPYTFVLPGSVNGYWYFTNLDELETAIKGRLQLYSLIAISVEQSIEQGFDDTAK